MEEFKLVLEKKERKKLDKDTRITSSVVGIILTATVLIDFDFDALLTLMVGLFLILYGIVGLAFFKTIYRISLSHDSLVIIKSYRQDVVINLKLVDYIQLKNKELQVHFTDYVRTYNLSWLQGDDYQELRDKLEELNFES